MWKKINLQNRNKKEKCPAMLMDLRTVSKTATMVDASENFLHGSILKCNVKANSFSSAVRAPNNFQKGQILWQFLSILSHLLLSKHYH